MLFNDDGGGYSTFSENIYEILLNMTRSYQHWFRDTLAKNDIDFLSFEKLKDFYTTKQITLLNDDLKEYYKENDKWKAKNRDLRSGFPFLENLEIDRVYFSDFIILHQLNYLKSINLGVLDLPFNQRPFNAVDKSGNLYFDENKTPDDLEGELLHYYLQKNPDIQMLKEFLRYIKQLLIPQVKFIIDVENAEYIYESNVIEIITDFFPNAKVNRIYEPILGNEFIISNISIMA